MGIMDFFSDLVGGLSSSEAHAEAPAKDDDDSTEEGGDEGEDKSEEDGKDEASDEDGGDSGSGEGGDEGGDDEEEEEEEEDEDEDEPVDLKPQFEEECARSAQCAGYKHHFDECTERVTHMQEHPDKHKGHPAENCVEEFFHLQHCAAQCAAPRLFKALK